MRSWWRPFNPPRDLSRHPVFQLVLNQAPIAYEKLESAGLTIEKLPFDDLYNPFDMELRFNTQGDGLLLTWKYNCALFSAQTIQRLLESLDLILRDGLDSPPNRLPACKYYPPWNVSG